MIFTTQKINESYWKISINHPPVNVFDPEFSIQLRTLMDELEANESLKVVVFESANPDFYVAHAELVNIFEFLKGKGKTGLSKSWPDVKPVFVTADSYAPCICFLLLPLQFFSGACISIRRETKDRRVFRVNE